MEKEKDVETLLKDLANYKVQMAAKVPPTRSCYLS
jgi:hypothetical protein